MDVLKKLEEKAFLGEDFLTWLWWRVEEEGAFHVPHPVTLWIEDRMVLASAESTETLVKGDDTSKIPEAFAALGRGKKLRAAHFGLIRDEWEFGFVLDARLDVTRLKLPKVLPPEDEDTWEGTALVRISLIEEIHRTVDALFSEFLDARIGSDWPKTLKAMQQWIKVGP